nr:glycosyltransferase family 2 protein [uncultured Carboxylicivirga sp.]
MSYNISIICATYNASATFDYFISSVRKQLDKNFELIIIDGDSKDDTLEKIKKNSDVIDCYISEPDSGIYDAWNKGVKLATGKWIMFLGADDFLFSDSIHFFNELLAKVNLSGYDYISATNEYIDESGSILKILGEDAKWSKMRRYMAAAHVGSLHNKHNLFQKVGNYDTQFKICGDYELLLRKGKSLKSYFLDKRIAQMKVGGMSFSLKAIIEAYQIRKHHKTINPLYNRFLFLTDVIGYELFKIKHHERVSK